ncbi:MAG: AI-2E family transporter [Candidatus Peregrinibacteria bacterium]
MKKIHHSKLFLKTKFGEVLIVEKLPGYFLILCLVAAFYFLVKILNPFLTVIFVGAVLVIAFYPVYRKLLKWFRGWSRLSSFVSCLLVVLVILVPLSLFVLLLATEAFDTYEIIQQKVNSGVFDKYLQWGDGGFFYDLKQQIEPVVNLDSIDLKKNIIGIAQSLSSFLVSQTTNLVRGLSNILLSIVVMLFVMYYFFKDGDKLVEKVGRLSPLPSVYETELFKKIADMVKAIVFGVFLTAVIQGVIGGVGFAIAGISNPVFWGAAMAFFSLLPVVGTALIWIPAALVLLIMGQWGVALFLALWGALVVGTVDNFVRPYLIGGKAHTYPLMTFLVVLGGVMTMGLKGVVIGPIILMVLMSFLHIYEAEYSKVLKK